MYLSNIISRSGVVQDASSSLSRKPVEPRTFRIQMTFFFAVGDSLLKAVDVQIVVRASLPTFLDGAEPFVFLIM
jgi:hypothetical protein